MIVSPRISHLQRTAEDYSIRLLERLRRISNRPPRSYGFEYEWIARDAMGLAEMKAVTSLLTEGMGYRWEEGQLVSGARRIVFEPGGQIEFLSPPLPPGPGAALTGLLEWIDEVLDAIRRGTGIEYLGRGYSPGRAEAPLLLRGERYTSMHRRFGSSGSMGWEMMKGTAAIHLHASILDIDELPELFESLRKLAEGPLSMSPRRRQIWCSTDECRCGMPPVERGVTEPLEVVRPMVRQALEAVKLGGELPFIEIPGLGFDSFLDHFTTMFTDIRLNLKGGTLELRTQDSVPLTMFEDVWSLFTSHVERALPSR